MDALVTHTLLQSPAHARIPSARSPSPNDSANPREKGWTTTNGLPASAYWTAYDHYMIERDARAYRRAYVYSTLATFVRHLRQSILNVRPGQA